jgi:arylformamidase
MKIYDISQEVFSCVVFPGDPAPKKNTVCSIDSGAVCNLTEFSMCAHNGTHIDAPYHFLNDGKSVDEIPLEKFTGYAFVADHEGLVSAEDAENILKKAAAANRESVKRILIKGKSTVSESAARVFAKEKIFLLGNESQTVGPKDAPMAVHKILLGEEMVLLEGIRLEHVPEGAYVLNAAPLCLSGADGAPCRAILIDLEN